MQGSLSTSVSACVCVIFVFCALILWHMKGNVLEDNDEVKGAMHCKQLIRNWSFSPNHAVELQIESLHQVDHYWRLSFRAMLLPLHGAPIANQHELWVYYICMFMGDLWICVWRIKTLYVNDCLVWSSKSPHLLTLFKDKQSPSAASGRLSTL